MPTPSPFNSARGLIESYFGNQIRLGFKETTLTVGTSAIAAGTQANQRVAVTFANCGGALIVVGLSSGVTATSGFPVPSNGFLTFNWFIDGELAIRDFFAISGSASQTLYICESILSVVN